MKLWLSMLTVTVIGWAMKASGPLAVGASRLPAPVLRITAVMTPALLAGLITVELGRSGWTGLDWPQLTGVGVAGVARWIKAPMLLAVLGGIVTAALLRLPQG